LWVALNAIAIAGSEGAAMTAADQRQLCKTYNLYYTLRTGEAQSDGTNPTRPLDIDPDDCCPEAFHNRAKLLYNPIANAAIEWATHNAPNGDR
jgi:hypothetical protein